jgi:alanine racemase
VQPLRGLAWAEVDLEALAANVATARRLVGSAELLAVVKADAYGLAAGRVVPYLAGRCGVRWFGVAHATEWLPLAAQGVQGRALVLSDPLPDAVPAVVEHGMTATVSCVETAERLAAEAGRRGATAAIHVSVDTGMGRFGARPGDVGRILDFAARTPSLRVEGLWTHLAEADVPDTGTARDQLRRFAEAGAAARAACPDLRVLHAANSAAIVNLPEAHFDMVRAGLILYGMHAARADHQSLPLRPVLAVRSRLLLCRRIRRGEPVGYGHTFVAPREMPGGIVGIGYAQGYFRSLSGTPAFVLVRGRRAPLVGRISMDYATVDLSGVPGARAGDVVTLLGRDGDDEIFAEDVAAWSGSIAHEVVCSLGGKLPKGDPSTTG